MIVLASSDPAVASVAPFGGKRAVFTPNPLAVGIPSSGDPVLIDISASITTNGMTARLRAQKQSFEHPWLLTHEGQPTNEPEALFTDPPGTILPTGGLDHGHKGYGLALLVEALTQGLGAFGRSATPRGWGASVFVQILDPDAFGGMEGYCRETDWLAQACRDTPPRPGVEAVRLPGARALSLRRAALERGVTLHAGIIETLREQGAPLGIDPPRPLA